MPRHYALVQVKVAPSGMAVKLLAVRRDLAKRVEGVLSNGNPASVPMPRVLLKWEESGEPLADGDPLQHELERLTAELEEPPPGFDPETLAAQLPKRKIIPFPQIARLVFHPSQDNAEGAVGSGSAEGAENDRMAGAPLNLPSERLKVRLFRALLQDNGYFRRTRSGFVRCGTAERARWAARKAEQQAHEAWQGRITEWIVTLERGEWPSAPEPSAAEFICQLRSLVAFEARSPDWKKLRKPLGLHGSDWAENRQRLKQWLTAAAAWPGWGAVWLQGAGVDAAFPQQVVSVAEMLACTLVCREGRADYAHLHPDTAQHSAARHPVAQHLPQHPADHHAAPRIRGDTQSDSGHGRTGDRATNPAMVRATAAYSLDAPRTRDIDDACAILGPSGDGLEVAVHIADPGTAIGPQSPLFAEAVRRTASVYTQEGTFPMLPESLSTDRFSLVAGAEREAMTFRLRIDSNGAELLALEPSLVCLKQNLDYHQGTQLLAEEPESWGRLAALCDLLRAQRQAAGAQFIERPEAVLDCRDPHRIGLVVIDRHEPVHRLVEELAILVNATAGRYCAHHKIPALYRIQPAATHLEAGKVPAARFSLVGERHFGLACDRYVQVTSPLRRITDLVMQRQILTHLRSGQIAFSESDLEDWMRLAEPRFASNHQLQRRIENHWKGRYLLQNPGFVSQGTVQRIDRTSHGRSRSARIWLEDLILTANADLPPTMRTNSRGRFRVSAVNLDREHVQAEFIEQLPAAKMRL